MPLRGAAKPKFSPVADATRGIFLYDFRGLKHHGYIQLVATRPARRGSLAIFIGVYLTERRIYRVLSKPMS